MQVIQSPEEGVITRPALYLAGPLGGRSKWRERLLPRLQQWPGTILNPQPLPAFGEISTTQYSWEFRHLDAADVIALWCPEYTFDHKTYLHLGWWLGKLQHIPLVVGIHPGYPHKSDIVNMLVLRDLPTQHATTLEQFADDILAVLGIKNTEVATSHDPPLDVVDDSFGREMP